MLFTFNEKTLKNLLNTYNKNTKFYAIIISEMINAEILEHQKNRITAVKTITENGEKGRNEKWQ